VSNLAQADLEELLGTSGDAMTHKFDLASDPLAQKPKLSAGERKNLNEAWELSKTLLHRLADQTIAPVMKNDLSSLDAQRLSTARTSAVNAQIAGYAAGLLADDTRFEPPFNKEAARIVLQAFYAGTLKDTKGSALPPRELLARELGRLGGDPEVVKAYVLDKANDGIFDPVAAKSPSSISSNLASVHAGEATLELAAKLVGERDAAAFVKHVFERPTDQLLQMFRDPTGPEGILLSFAAAAHHLGWEAAKLADGLNDAKAGKDDGLHKWQHKNLGATRRLLAQDPTAARKVADQISSFLINRGELVPFDRAGSADQLDLHYMLDTIARSGIYADGSEGMRVLSPYATGVQKRLASDVRNASRLADWQVGAEIAANSVAHMGAAFAANATGAGTSYRDREELVTTFRGALTELRGEADKLLANGPPAKSDQAYQALYQDRSGEVSFDALHKMLGESARPLIRDATFGDLIPQALKSLRLDDSGDFTPKNLVADLKDLQGTLLQGDYFLSQPGFLDSLDAEAKKGTSKADPKGLEVAVRLPNAAWMWLLLIRGLVENKLNRLEGSQTPDYASDKFPDSVQFNPPDVRDVELFSWAKNRLIDAHGVEPERATREALSLVVFTLYKDLLQVRKGAEL
jgi:hypothetical protein